MLADELEPKLDDFDNDHNLDALNKTVRLSDANGDNECPILYEALRLFDARKHQVTYLDLVNGHDHPEYWIRSKIAYNERHSDQIDSLILWFEANKKLSQLVQK